ncbi:MAG TPA: type II toxin-antitoxin system prevent-host-death family antitoxin [Acidobacteriaceae bacterium]
MRKTILSSRELNQDIGRAKKAARFGPVIITDRGRPAFVLTTFEAHRRATGSKKLSLFDALSMPEDDIELELPVREMHPGPIDLD